MPVVISSDMSLDEVDDAPEGSPWIGWHNLVTSSNIDASTEDTDHPAANLANPATHLYWLAGTNTADEYLTVETGSLDEIDYVAIAGHNLGTAQSIASVEGKFSTADSPDVAYVEKVEEHLFADNAPLIFRFEPQILSHVRLRLQQGSVPARIATMYVGKLLVCERSIKIDVDHVPIKYGRRSTIVSGMSESGNFLGRIVQKQWRESTAEFAHFEPDWYRTYFEDFVAAAVEAPFFWAWEPVNYPTECGYAWLINQPEPATSPVTERVSVTLNMRGVA